MQFLKELFKTPEQVKYFIDISNLIFIIFIIYIGLKTLLKYKEISTLVSYFNEIYKGFNNPEGRGLKKSSLEQLFVMLHLPLPVM